MKKQMIDNPFFTFMGRLADLCLLNLIFLATCIPVITIGTADTALYKVMLKFAKGESAYPVREYLTAFHEEWKQSMKTWLIYLAVGIILVFDIFYIGHSWNVWGIGVGILLCIWSITVSYVFPIQAQFDNTIKNTVKNACYMSIRHLPYTIGIVALNMIPFGAFLAGGYWFGLVAPIYFVIGFSLTARINVVMFQNIFSKYM